MSEDANKKPSEYIQKLSVLVGGRVSGIATDPRKPDLFGLVIRNLAGTKIVWFMKDTETHEPGAYHLQELAQNQPAEEKSKD